MEFFESSGNWMMALGKTLVHSLWIGLLFLSILKFGLQLIAGRNSHLRYMIATGTLIVFLGSVTTLFLILYTPFEDSSIGISNILKILLTIPGMHELTGAVGSSPVKVICYGLSYIYFTGMLVVLIRAILSVRHIHGLKRSGIPVRKEWMNRFLKLKSRIGVMQSVELLISDRVSVPALIGLFKPAIIVPMGMFTNLPVNQVETILIHELYHLRRLDFLVNILQLVVEGLFFYNPAVWSISHVIRTERENCCDDRVLQTCEHPLVYARALFQLANHHRTINTLVTGAGGTDQHQLFNRITRILNQATMKTNIREKLFTLLFMAGGLIILLSITGFSSGFSIVRHDYFKVTASDTIPELEKEEMEAAKVEVPEEIDWEEIKEEIEAAKLEAMEEIDWEEIENEMIQARIHMDSIMENFDFDFDLDIDIDLDDLKVEMEEAIKEMKKIDWEEIQMNIDKALEGIDIEKIRREIERSFEEIDLDMKKHSSNKKY